MAEDNNGNTPNFTDAYYKSRKFYALYAGILLAIELFGVRIEEEPFANINIKFLSPNALPIVFILLMIYYGTRYTIDWYQSNVIRRSLKVSRLDFWISHGIAIAAMLVYLVQRISEVQLISGNDSTYDLITFISVTMGATAISYAMARSILLNASLRTYLKLEKRKNLLFLGFWIIQAIVVFTIYARLRGWLDSIIEFVSN